MEAWRDRGPVMARRLGEFMDPFSGRLISVTYRDGFVSMRYINGETTPPVVVAAKDFNDWYVKILVPTKPMQKIGSI